MRVNSNIKESVTNTIFIFVLQHKIYRATNRYEYMSSFFPLSLTKCVMN